jgi:hypothetical protein
MGRGAGSGAGGGAGNDGGVINTKRADLIKVKAPEHKSSSAREDEAGLRLTTCALSGAPLAEPLMADELGNLFNKEALLTAVLKGALPAAFSHIRKLKKDAFDVRPSFLQAAGGSGSRAAGAGAGAGSGAAALHSAVESGVHALFSCSITGLEASGKHP